MTASRDSATAEPAPPRLRRRSAARTAIGRVYGLGNVFAKTFRDSRVGMWVIVGFFAVMWFVSGAVMTRTFATAASRRDAVELTQSLPPVIQGLFGGTQPNVQALGGFTNWRFGFLFFLVPGIWSLFALSSTLLNEARRGSLEFVAAGPISRRRIALQKLGGHVAAMAVAMFVTALVAWLVGAAFGRFSAQGLASIGATTGDAIPLAAALNYTLLLGLVGLAFGAIAFALAPFLGRGAAAGIAGALMGAGWFVYGYRESIGLFDTLKFLSPYYWTAGHRPVAGLHDWVSLLPLVAMIVVGFAVGILAFERRDLGATGTARTPGLPRALAGLHGPAGRSLSERFPGAAWWGIGIGIYGFIIADSGNALRESITQNAGILRIFRAAFPNVNLDSPGFGLQLAFLTFGYLVTGLAVSRLVNAWASDEGEGRLEMVLATPTGRARWFLASAGGVFGSIVILTAIVAIGIGLGVVSATHAGAGPSAGSPSLGVFEPMLGTATLLLYGAAIAGIGFAVAGLWRSPAADVVCVVVVAATLLIDILVPALRLPEWFHNLALTNHYGKPMLGDWDATGAGVSLVLAFGGLALGAWGFSRRDLRR